MKQFGHFPFEEVGKPGQKREYIELKKFDIKNNEWYEGEVASSGEPEGRGVYVMMLDDKENGGYVINI